MNRTQIKSYIKLISFAQVGLLFTFLLMISFGLPFISFIWPDSMEINTNKAKLCYIRSGNSGLGIASTKAIALLILKKEKYIKLFETPAPTYYSGKRIDWNDCYNSYHTLIKNKFLKLGGSERNRCVFLNDLKVHAIYKKKFGLLMSIKFLPTKLEFDEINVLGNYYNEQLKGEKIGFYFILVFYSGLFLSTFFLKRYFKNLIKIHELF